MISNVAFIPLFGFPLIMYGGILTFLSLFTTVTLGILINRGYRVSFTLHKTMAILTLTLAVIHGILGLSFLFKF